ncbi:MAG TPA: hypothetical protein VNM90_19195, partial [Haliangium sp.]|nr:hypothetical protein [Haliangium sp.]
GALEWTDAKGQRSEGFSATLPLGCARTPEARGVLLSAQCTGADGAVQLTAQRSQKEVIISASGPAAGKSSPVAPGADSAGKAAQGARILARIPLSPDTRTIRPRAGATDAARVGELLLDWSFATYHDVHVVIERPGAPEAKLEARPEANIDEFITELAGCEQPGQAPAQPQGAAATLACRHRGSTATLTATSRPGVVIVTHTVSGEGLEQHQVDSREIPLPALPAAGTP